MEWRQFTLDDPPAESGVYAIKGGGRWLYIGSSQNIARRLKSTRHPAQITKGLESLALSFWWQPREQRPGGVGQALVEEHQPEQPRGRRPGAAEQAPMEWRRFSLGSPPMCSGIYAIKRGRRWLYIGISINIAQRVSGPRHPAQITRSLPGLSYHYAPMESGLHRVERQLHQELSPEWNGGTSWSTPRHVVPRGPHCVIDDGWGDFVSPADEAAALELLN